MTPDAPAADAPFAGLVQTAEAIAATTKRLEKKAHAAGYLASLADADLERAARYLAGRLFPLHDQRAVRVGPATIFKATAAATSATRDELEARLVTLGDPGDVAAEAIAQGEPSDVTLARVEAWIGELAALGGTNRRTERLAEMLGRLSAAEARYFVKLLAGDLRIGFKEGSARAAIAAMADVPQGDVRRANMLTGDLGASALLARHGRLDQAEMRLFHPVRFMLATAADSDDEVVRQMPERFFVEDKFDGIRAQAHVGPESAAPGANANADADTDADADALHGTVHLSDGRAGGTRVALFSRTLDAITPAFPDLVAPLVEAAAAFPDGAILDGEIIPIGQDAAARPFQALQRRLGRKNVPEALIKEVPVAFVAFDVLLADGDVLLDTPFHERRARMESIAAGPLVHLSEVQEMTGPDGLDAAFMAARARGNEGLMVKAPEAAYRPGRRGRSWLKMKRALATLDVVVTSVEVGSGKRSHLLSDFTFAVRKGQDDGALLNVGKAYSGLTDAELADLTEWFKAHTLETSEHGRVRRVQPEVVIEVAFDRVQPSDLHASGYALRFPRIVRLRPDKPVREIDTVEAARLLTDEAKKEADGTPLDKALPHAEEAFRAWMEARDKEERLVVLCHFDADGLSAGALLTRGLRRLGFADVHVEPSRRGENVFFDEAAKARLRELEPAALVVADLGVNAAGVLAGVPTLYVDHHRPEGTPEGTVVSGYGWEPIPTSAWLAYELLHAVAGDAVDDLLWLGAVGTVGDLGDGAPWPRLGEAKEKFTAKWTKEAVVLANAARRASAFDIQTPLRLLLEGEHPKHLSEGPGADKLAAYRAEVNAAVKEARKAAPAFSETEPFALLKLHSACQVHPLIAQQWRGRLEDYAVIAANTGYLPGTVAFSTRTRRDDLSLPEVYGDVDLGEHNDDFGHGHDKASGGHLPPEAFNRLLDALGFSEEAHVEAEAVAT